MFKKSLFIKSFFILLTAFFLTACTPIKPLSTHHTDVAGLDGKTVRKADVEWAIFDVLKTKKMFNSWTGRKIKDGQIEAILDNRQHEVVLNIFYDANGYEIAYKDSKNMDYNPETKTIHAKYDTWVRNLDLNIRKSLSTHIK